MNINDMAAAKMYGVLPLFDPAQGETVLEPEGKGAGYWVGAPSLLWDEPNNRFLLTYRRRRPRGLGSDRGYVACVAESQDGLHFRDIWSVHKEEWQTTSMEKFSLIRGLDNGYRLYTSYVDPADNRWRIGLLEASSPNAFDATKMISIFTADEAAKYHDRPVEGVKDPYVFLVGNLYHMFISMAERQQVTQEQAATMHSTADAYNTGLITAPTALATSLDGIHWAWQGRIMDVNQPGSWDAYQARLNSVIYRSPVWIGFYDGTYGVEGNYEEKTGMALSSDLHRWTRLTPAEPILTSQYASHSLRYVEVLPRSENGHTTYYYFYEFVREDGSHELRRSVVRL